MFKNPEQRGVDMRTFMEAISGIYPNRSIEKAVKVCGNLYGNAKESIKIVSGRLNSKFYNAPRIVGAFEKALEKNVSIEIVCGPAIDPDTKEIIELSKKGFIKIFQLKSNNLPKAHFSIVDEKHLRLEMPHPAEAELGTTEADVVLDASFDDVKGIVAEFERLKSEAQPTSFPEVESLQSTTI
jgi:sugar-specific transcriptional regulator TrmB